MRLLSAIRNELICHLPGPNPLVVGKYETRMPAPNVVIRYLEPFDLDVAGTAVVLARHGRQGVVALRDDEGPEDGAVRAKEARMDYLQEFFDAFRNHNAELAAQQIPVILPRKRHRLMLKELEDLQKELLPSGLLAGGESPGRIRDAAAQDMEKFGLPTSAVPLVPGNAGVIAGIGDL